MFPSNGCLKRHLLPSIGSLQFGSPTSAVLRDAPTPCHSSRRTSLPSFGDTIVSSSVRPRQLGAGAADQSGVDKPEPRPAITVEMAGSLRFPSDPRVPAPCSRTPVGPMHARPLQRLGAAPA